jgi:biotin carboxylase
VAAACAWCADLADLPAALAGARREAQSAFGDGTLMLERLIDDGRHIEIQVFCRRPRQRRAPGRTRLHAQRRRQKVIEEAPSPVVNPVMRAAMGRDAVAAALAVGYRGAGTVEFIVDEDLNHYFLEMNTRLQVEHPVTECITGLDLVEWQLRVAAGEPLPLTQDQISFSGHAIEAAPVRRRPLRRLEAADRPHPGLAARAQRRAHRPRHRRRRRGHALLRRHGGQVHRPRPRPRRRHPPPGARAGRCAADRPAQQRPLPARPAAAPAVHAPRR